MSAPEEATSQEPPRTGRFWGLASSRFFALTPCLVARRVREFGRLMRHRGHAVRAAGAVARGGGRRVGRVGLRLRLYPIRRRDTLLRRSPTKVVGTNPQLKNSPGASSGHSRASGPDDFRRSRLRVHDRLGARVRGAMGSALDDVAERALVTGSWSKASDAAATARRVARTARRPGRRRVRVGAGGSTSSRAGRGDARGGRAAGHGRAATRDEPQTLLLWSRLTLAAGAARRGLDPRRTRTTRRRGAPRRPRRMHAGGRFPRGVPPASKLRAPPAESALDLTTDRTSTVRRDAIDQSSDGSSDDKSSDDTAAGHGGGLAVLRGRGAGAPRVDRAAEWLRASTTRRSASPAGKTGRGVGGGGEGSTTDDDD